LFSWKEVEMGKHPAEVGSAKRYASTGIEARSQPIPQPLFDDQFG
jgi:hypothetical protein